ncbi:MAG: LysM peptidoglycan-binding domain-containing protein [Bacteroidia bacterium]|nr:LysM peptidoglycan-binding domain-containing protein [Bacteroidia bacterium]HQU99701.1 LysM peptidoglycan-binding domain-containing protein [Bacteroidia bacterium]
MRKFLFIYILIFVAAPYLSIADNNNKRVSGQNTPAKYIDGKKHVMHKVAKAETFYSIARLYKIDVKDLMASNKGVSLLKAGQIIQVPVPETYTDLVRTGVEENAKEITPDEKQTETKPAVYHKVKKGETLSAIAKKYQVQASQIAALNNLKKSQVNINQKLLIKKAELTAVSTATVAPVTQVVPASNIQANTTQTYEHVVKKGETLYGIARTYQVDPKEISRLNNLQNNGIKTGQILVLKKPESFDTATIKTRTNETKIDAPKSAAVETAVDQIVNEPAPAKPTADAITVIDKTPSGKDVKQAIENGEGAWVNDADLNPNKYFALHPSAPIGTIVKVTNKMNGKYVFVKVIGKLPGTGDNENLIIKVSKAAADRMGILDQKFQCELNYAFASAGN